MEDRVFLIDKPAGISSFGVVAKVRGYLRNECGHKVKVGHTGTLDPFATGLLILLSGKMTKKSNEFLKFDKEYVAELKLGFKSSTGDSEGEIEIVDNRVPDIKEIESVLRLFIGDIEQIPPKYSAIKINGQRAYKLARKGVDFEVPMRKIRIYNIEVLEYEYPRLAIRCRVSSGTYIRTLAEDIGLKLGVGAYLTALRRTKIGEYSVDKACTLKDFVLH